mmetsp:Transcript_4603/g.6647  ORF Transcript_4603/g.6647 Transcript_4603/m.6647 type:complete len:97 (-) Transcript_4603:38-328(-)
MRTGGKLIKNAKLRRKMPPIPTATAGWREDCVEVAFSVSELSDEKRALKDWRNSLSSFVVWLDLPINRFFLRSYIVQSEAGGRTDNHQLFIRFTTL